MKITRPDVLAQGKGRCLCGQVTYELRAHPFWTAHCHCDSCRRQCSAPFASFYGVAYEARSWTGAEPEIYRSAPDVRRSLSRSCGTPTAYSAKSFPGETHFFAANMDDPAVFQATYHVHAKERLKWVHLSNGLPRIEGATS